MAALTWKDISLEWKVVTFPRSKAGFSYQVPLNETAVRAFETLRALSSGDGPILGTRSPRRWFNSACRRANISGLRLHDLRHSFATRLRAAGTRIEDIGALLGHTPLHAMTERYAAPSLDGLREAVAKLDENNQTTKETTKPRIATFRKAATA